jgi:hypothetical protein
MKCKQLSRDLGGPNEGYSKPCSPYAVVGLVRLLQHFISLLIFGMQIDNLLYTSGEAWSSLLRVPSDPSWRLA